MTTPIPLTWWTDNKGRESLRIERPWGGVVELLEQAPHQGVKDESPLLKLATFGSRRTGKGALRHDGNVLEVTGIEGEHDNGEMSPEAARGLLEDYNLRGVVVTTWSHTPEHPRWRTFLPLSRAVKPEKRAHLVAALNGILQGALAPESFALSQSYYVGPKPGAEYLVLPTFDDPEEGVCLDELDPVELEALALQGKPSTNGSGPHTIQDSGGEGLPDDIEQIMEHLDPGCGYAEWLRVGAALKHADAVNGLEVFDTWSKGCPEKYPGRTEIEAKWASFNAETRTQVGKKIATLGTVRHMAMERGYKAPPKPPPATEVEEVEPGPSLDEDGKPKLPAPMGVSDLLAVEEPEEEWLAHGILPAGGNVLVAGYPKTFKTMYNLDLGVSLASGTPFLGKFEVPEKRRVGIVLMEDQAHRVRRRLQRLCEGKGITLDDLEGWLYLWFRPPLRLNDQTAVELADYVADLDLDFLGVDSWAYVASGDSNSADEVTPQLMALTYARVKRPGLTVQLTHHARKDHGKREAGTRLTDEIRNSGAFGAWFDAGMVLSRKDETSPVTVRTELRDFPTPESFAFQVEDEEPAYPGNDWNPQGWLRLVVSKYRPELLDRMAAAQNLVPAVREFLTMNPGCSKRAIRNGVTGRNPDIDGALDLLEEEGEVEIIESAGPGKPSQIRLREGAE